MWYRTRNASQRFAMNLKHINCIVQEGAKVKILFNGPRDPVVLTFKPDESNVAPEKQAEMCYDEIMAAVDRANELR